MEITGHSITDTKTSELDDLIPKRYFDFSCIKIKFSLCLSSNHAELPASDNFMKFYIYIYLFNMPLNVSESAVILETEIYKIQ